MSERRFNANKPLGQATRRTVEHLQRQDADARALFERVRAKQFDDHPPVAGGEHTAAQRANGTQMANKAVAIVLLDWMAPDAEGRPAP